MTKTIAQTYKENNPNLRVDFNQPKFLGTIEQKGLNITWEKMCVCPCRKDVSSQAVVECINCGGTGFYFFDLQNIKAMISGAALQKNFINWTEVLTGSILLSMDPLYKVGWYDRITVLDAESVYSEIKLVKILNEDNGIKTIQLRYEPTEIISVFSYLDEATPLKVIALTDVVQSGKYLTINDDAIVEGESISVIYNYHPTYLVVDHLNDYRNTYVKNGLAEEELKKLPIKVLAKKLHLVLV